MHKVERWERQLEKVYASLPQLACKGLCPDSCGPIAVFHRENQRLREVSGRSMAFRADIRCTYLTSTKQCSVYAVRPIICRLFGMVEHAMRCKHGCEPSRWLTPEEGHEVMRKVREICGPASGPTPDESVDPKIAAYVRKVAKEYRGQKLEGPDGV